MKSPLTFQSSKSAHRLFVFSLFFFIVAQVSAFVAGLVFYPERLQRQVDAEESSKLRFAILARQDKAFADKVWHESSFLNGDEQQFLPLFFQSSAELVRACELGLVDVAYLDFYSFEQLGDLYRPLMVESDRGTIQAQMDRSVLVVRAKDISLKFNDLDQRVLAYVDSKEHSSDHVPRHYLEGRYGDLSKAFKDVQVYQNPLSMIKALDKESLDMIALSQDDFYRSLERLGQGRNRYRFLWLSKAYPSHLIAVRKDLSDDLSMAVEEQFDESFYGEGHKETDFVHVTESSIDFHSLQPVPKDVKEAI